MALFPNDAPLGDRRERDCLSATGAWREAVADDEGSLRLIQNKVCLDMYQSKLGHSRFRIRTERPELGQ